MFRCTLRLPQPNQYPVKLKDNLRVLLISEQVNSLTRRVQNVLRDKKVITSVLETSDSGQMVSKVKDYQPDVIICPFMKTRIPSELYNHQKRPCMIVHPGIAGDRGASSLDWAILNKKQTWGVTVLEATDEFDSGDIWSTETFKVPENSTKSSMYNGGVSDSAVKCILDSLSRYSQTIPPVPLADLDVLGTAIRNMTNSDRLIDWTSGSGNITTQVRMSDTRPGAIGRLVVPGFDGECRMFDAHAETGRNCAQVAELMKKAKPGNIVAKRNKSLLIKSGDDDGVWIGQMKKMTKDAALKLPSEDFLANVLKTTLFVPTIDEPCSHEDIKVVRRGDVAYVYFDFYNGAMDQQQGIRLAETLALVNNMDDVKFVALMGGERFFSTGINLCVIESSPNKQMEAWAIINAVDDVIETFVNMTNKVTIAGVRSNSGAGGTMMAAACDLAVSHEGALHLPSYKSMHLYGSEYWTYFLPKRVGYDTAKTMVDSLSPFSAEEAKSAGLIDHVVVGDKQDFTAGISTYIEQLIKDGVADNIIRRKRTERDVNWRQLLQSHRFYELTQMQKDFRSTAFLTAMNKFVYH